MNRCDTDDRGRFVARPEADRFWSNVDITDGCWLWTGLLSYDGYPIFKVKRNGTWTYVRAHRWAWERLVGPIRPGWTLDHLIQPGGPCTSKTCVRVPDHLEEVTRAENARRAAAWRRAMKEARR